MEIEIVIEVFTALCLIWFCSLVLYWCNVMWLHPQRICNKMRRQGISGPPPSFLYGNLTEMKRLALKEKENIGEPITHHYTPTVLPYFEKWRKRYGMFSNFLLSLGHELFHLLRSFTVTQYVTFLLQ